MTVLTKNRKTVRRLFAVLMIFLAIAFPGAAEETDTGESTEVLTANGEFPELNEDGFLDEGEFVYLGDEEGVWRYAGQGLRVEVIRKSQDKPKLVWYEAEVWSDGSEIFRMIPNDPEKRMSSQAYPYRIARKNGTVLAVNSDYAHLRIKQKSRVGILIRDGEIISERTLKKNKGTFPNLDTLALFPDGDMKVFWSDELKAREYLDLGAVDVLAFGPWLIRDGELNTKGLKKYGTSKAQRAAVGMVEKGHYFVMMLEGRIKRSTGAGISFLAERMQERGCTQAFNLDGGATSCIVFMGHQLNKETNRNANVSARKTAEILGIGHSDLLPAPDDPW